ncbi:MerR family transcriptional regulator [Halodesulfovibrio sp.]|jgi:phage terminase Nu1 subunit (DNA packaging protein)|uniref:MerR family transcriptional regulator n=1 Tax=Halodesulfovibrio sp. TaxID=1912772 RepID=UPI0025E155F9|nr:MerR family transcriptional regulator [Halodesulfovibrio sp.]MCT4626985.1 MerR family transcriptional regulator [Halodesulfovibrio sp.]
MTVVAPVMLKSMSEICETFGKSRPTVLKWRKEGAPIYKEGRSYGAELNALSNWLVKHTSHIEHSEA